MRRFTPRRPWAPLTDAEWQALRPFLRQEGSPGRPLGTDPRTRLDALLHAATTGLPWHALPAAYGRGPTLARHFRRLAKAGLWSRLLEALAHPKAPPALRALEYWLCRAARRAMRLLGMKGLDLAQRLGLLSALPMVPWMLPNRDLSQHLAAHIAALLHRLPAHRPPPGTLRQLGQLLATAGGRRVWSKKFAPP
jgi:transposase